MAFDARSGAARFDANCPIRFAVALSNPIMNLIRLGKGKGVIRRQYFALYCVLAVANVVLVATSMAISRGMRCPFELINSQLDLTQSGNLAAWLCTLQLLGLALSALAIGCMTAAPFGMSDKAYRTTWMGAGAFVLVVALLENVQTRALIAGPLAALLNAIDMFGQRMGIEHMQALRSGLGLVVGLGVVWLIYMAYRSLSLNRFSKLVGVGGLTCWAVAIACWSVQGGGAQTTGFLAIFASNGLREICELLGGGMLLLTFAEHLRRELALIRPAVTAMTPAPAPEWT